MGTALRLSQKLGHGGHGRAFCFVEQYSISHGKKPTYNIITVRDSLKAEAANYIGNIKNKNRFTNVPICNLF